MDRQKKTTNLVKISKHDKNNSDFNKIIINSIIIFTISLLCLFFNLLNPLLVNWLKDDFGVVSSKDSLIVHFINVGQGDAIAINLPDDKIVLIDAGPINETTEYINYIKQRVTNNRRNNLIDYLILTHADSDHIGGAVKLTKLYDFGTIFMPSIDSETETYKTLKALVNAENCIVTTYLEEFVIENEYILKIFAPLSFSDTNNSCPLIKLEYKNKSFLFTGDIEKAAEQKYIETYGDELDVDVLKIAHHGSKYSSSEEFLEQTTPEYSVISSGNKYGHPNQEVLDRLNSIYTHIVRTDTKGNIMFAVGKNYDLDLLTGDYVVTAFVFDYRYVVLVIDILLLIDMTVCLLKKNKNKKYLN